MQKLNFTSGWIGSDYMYVYAKNTSETDSYELTITFKNLNNIELEDHNKLDASSLQMRINPQDYELGLVHRLDSFADVKINWKFMNKREDYDPEKHKKKSKFTQEEK